MIYLLTAIGFCGLFQTPEGEGDEEPKPIVLIDQDSDAEATIVEISFGNRLGALLDTVGYPPLIVDLHLWFAASIFIV